ncbi:hypothetical protein V1509DRAFT_126887 [Lipomyces kononenkoae]
MPPNESQEVVEYLNPDGYCRRFVLGKYMDGIGYSCLSSRDETAKCDRCIRTGEMIMNLQSTGTDEQHAPVSYKPHIVQHPEGPLPAIKRIKPGSIVEIRDNIQAAFGSIIRDYEGCVLCALGKNITFHRDVQPHQLLIDHGLDTIRLKDLDAQLSVRNDGQCYGCGLSLVVLNLIDQHQPSHTCMYKNLSRLACYDTFVSGRLSGSLSDIDSSSLRVHDMASFAKWLTLRPLGEKVNNLTRLIDGWSKLINSENDPRPRYNDYQVKPVATGPPNQQQRMATRPVTGRIPDDAHRRTTEIGKQRARQEIHSQGIQSVDNLGHSSVEIEWPKELLSSQQYRFSDDAHTQTAASEMERPRQRNYSQDDSLGVGSSELSIDIDLFDLPISSVSRPVSGHKGK